MTSKFAEHKSLASERALQLYNCYGHVLMDVGQVFLSMAPVDPYCFFFYETWLIDWTGDLGDLVKKLLP